MDIISHRGIDRNGLEVYSESSFEAFQTEITRGFGVEIDPQITLDKKFVLWHEADLFRMSQGKDKRKISEISEKEFLSLNYLSPSHTANLPDILSLIDTQDSSVRSAIHIKGENQKATFLLPLSHILSQVNSKKYICFDLKPEWGKYLLNRNNKFILAASVSHEYDIKRYGQYTDNTLISINEVLNFHDIYQYCWLDEWDTEDANHMVKNFYSVENVKLLTSKGFKIAIISPELHKSSPGLLGGESHKGAQSFRTLHKYFHNIIKLSPDIVCTDYPNIYKKIKENEKVG